MNTKRLFFSFRRQGKGLEAEWWHRVALRIWEGLQGDMKQFYLWWLKRGWIGYAYKINKLIIEKVILKNLNLHFESINFTEIKLLRGKAHLCRNNFFIWLSEKLSSAISNRACFLKQVDEQLPWMPRTHFFLSNILEWGLLCWLKYSRIFLTFGRALSVRVWVEVEDFAYWWMSRTGQGKTCLSWPSKEHCFWQRMIHFLYCFGNKWALGLFDSLEQRWSLCTF